MPFQNKHFLFTLNYLPLHLNNYEIYSFFLPFSLVFLNYFHPNSLSSYSFNPTQSVKRETMKCCFFPANDFTLPLQTTVIVMSTLLPLYQFNSDPTKVAHTTSIDIEKNMLLSSCILTSPFHFLHMKFVVKWFILNQTDKACSLI